MKLMIKIINKEQNKKILNFYFSENNKAIKEFDVDFDSDTTNEISSLFDYILNVLYNNKGQTDIDIEKFEDENTLNNDQKIVKSYCELLKNEIQDSKTAIYDMFLFEQKSETPNNPQETEDKNQEK